MIFGYLTSFLGALLLSFVLTRYVRYVAVPRGWVRLATSMRHIHSEPMPRLGGAAIYLAFVTITGIVITSSFYFDFDLGLPRQSIISILIAGTIVFLLGLCDDIRPVHPYIKI